ncbi:hypothetical protein BdWA1_003004 [Babesia duncani]|uniref:Uncharacterized protein n=1 Tax=Babesia duncani TaxID=323732 RepID=A0AAD9PI75_9APIC|nr:hypothetical protein BdWA1_003004 [Babesia duncani]
MCWTPKCRLQQDESVNLLCTITINNRIDIWHIPIYAPPDTLLYAENLAQLNLTLTNDCVSKDVAIFPESIDSMHAVPSLLMRCMHEYNFTSADFTTCNNGDSSSLFGFVAIGKFICVFYIAPNVGNVISHDNEGYSSRLLVHDDVSSVNSVDQSKWVIVNNKSNADFNLYDPMKCKALFPIYPTRTYSKGLHSQLIGIAQVPETCGIVAINVSEGTRLFVATLDGSLYKIELHVSTHANGQIAVEWKNKSLILKLQWSLELLKRYSIAQGEMLFGIACGHLVCYDIQTGEWVQVAISTIPLVSYMLRFIYQTGDSLAEIEIVDASGTTHMVELTKSLEIIRINSVKHKNEPKSILYGCCNVGISSYQCKIMSSQVRLEHQLVHASLFVNVLEAIDDDWKLKVIKNHLLFNKLSISSRSMLFKLRESPPINIANNDWHQLALELIRQEKYQMLKAMYQSMQNQQDRHLKALVLYLVASTSSI